MEKVQHQVPDIEKMKKSKQRKSFWFLDYMSWYFNENNCLVELFTEMMTGKDFSIGEIG